MARRKLKRDGRLKCVPRQLIYNWGIGVGELYLVEGHCCDMSGCTDLFEAIDPKVRLIRTYSGQKADTVYARDNLGEGNWVAQGPWNGDMYDS